MCGIVGLIARKQSGFYGGDLDLMQNLLLLDQIRGDDSTGVFSVMRDRSICLTKIGSHPAHLFRTKEWEKNRGKTLANGRIIIGHNRKATTGVVNSMNAHPFHENNIVLVHNGTMRGNHKKMADVEVDSHAICHSFNEKGAEAVIPTLDAAFAFIWWDIAKSRLFAVRNLERPLAMVITEDLNILCSEPWMAVGLIERASKKVEKVITFEAGMVYEFTLDGTYTTHKIELHKFDYSTNRTMTGRGSWCSNGYYGSEYEDLEDDTIVGATNPKVSGGTTQTPFESAANNIVQSAHFRPHVAYARNDTVLIRITSLRYDKGPNQPPRASGIVTEPGKPPMDFVGFLPPARTREEYDLHLNADCTANILGVTDSNCGPSMWVNQIKFAPMVKLHNTDIPERVWSYVVMNVKCKDCSKKLYYCDSKFSSVSRRVDGWRVSCSDCIEDKLTGDVKDEFAKRRLAALQDGIDVEQKPATSPLVLVKSDGTATIH